MRVIDINIPWDDISAFIDVLFKKWFIEFETPEAIMNFVSFYITKSKDIKIEQWLKDLSKTLPSNQRCTVTFEEEIMTAVRCNTCGKYPTSIICIDCFDPSKHVGHNYYYEKISSDGNCDCGDPVSFDPNGFCNRHRNHKKVEDPDLLLNPIVKHHLIVLFYSLLFFGASLIEYYALYECIDKNNNDPKTLVNMRRLNDYKPMQDKIFSLLGRFGKEGPSTRRLLARVLLTYDSRHFLPLHLNALALSFIQDKHIYTHLDTESLISILFYYLLSISDQTYKLLLRFFFVMIIDKWFLSMWAKQYSSILRNIITKAYFSASNSAFNNKINFDALDSYVSSVSLNTNRDYLTAEEYLSVQDYFLSTVSLYKNIVMDQKLKVKRDFLSTFFFQDPRVSSLLLTLDISLSIMFSEHVQLNKPCQCATGVLTLETELTINETILTKQETVLYTYTSITQRLYDIICYLIQFIKQLPTYKQKMAILILTKNMFEFYITYPPRESLHEKTLTHVDYGKANEPIYKGGYLDIYPTFYLFVMLFWGELVKSNIISIPLLHVTYYIPTDILADITKTFVHLFICQYALNIYDLLRFRTVQFKALSYFDKSSEHFTYNQIITGMMQIINVMMGPQIMMRVLVQGFFPQFYRRSKQEDFFDSYKSFQESEDESLTSRDGIMKSMCIAILYILYGAYCRDYTEEERIEELLKFNLSIQDLTYSEIENVIRTNDRTDILKSCVNKVSDLTESKGSESFNYVLKKEYYSSVNLFHLNLCPISFIRSFIKYLGRCSQPFYKVSDFDNHIHPDYLQSFYGYSHSPLICIYIYTCLFIQKERHLSDSSVVTYILLVLHALYLLLLKEKYSFGKIQYVSFSPKDIDSSSFPSSIYQFIWSKMNYMNYEQKSIVDLLLESSLLLENTPIYEHIYFILNLYAKTKEQKAYINPKHSEAQKASVSANLETFNQISNQMDTFLDLFDDIDDNDDSVPKDHSVKNTAETPIDNHVSVSVQSETPSSSNPKTQSPVDSNGKTILAGTENPIDIDIPVSNTATSVSTINNNDINNDNNNDNNNDINKESVTVESSSKEICFSNTHDCSVCHVISEESTQSQYTYMLGYIVAYNNQDMHNLRGCLDNFLYANESIETQDSLLKQLQDCGVIPAGMDIQLFIDDINNMKKSNEMIRQQGNSIPKDKNSIKGLFSQEFIDNNFSLYCQFLTEMDKVYSVRPITTTRSLTGPRFSVTSSHVHHQKYRFVACNHYIHRQCLSSLHLEQAVCPICRRRINDLYVDTSLHLPINLPLNVKNLDKKMFLPRDSSEWKEKQLCAYEYIPKRKCINEDEDEDENKNEDKEHKNEYIGSINNINTIDDDDDINGNSYMSLYNNSNKYMNVNETHDNNNKDIDIDIDIDDDDNNNNKDNNNEDNKDNNNNTNSTIAPLPSLHDTSYLPNTETRFNIQEMHLTGDEGGDDAYNGSKSRLTLQQIIDTFISKPYCDREFIFQVPLQSLFFANHDYLEKILGTLEQQTKIENISSGSQSVLHTYVNSVNYLSNMCYNQDFLVNSDVPIPAIYPFLAHPIPEIPADISQVIYDRYDMPYVYYKYLKGTQLQYLSVLLDNLYLRYIVNILKTNEGERICSFYLHYPRVYHYDFRGTLGGLDILGYHASINNDNDVYTAHVRAEDMIHQLELGTESVPSDATTFTQRQIESNYYKSLNIQHKLTLQNSLNLSDLFVDLLNNAMIMSIIYDLQSYSFNPCTHFYTETLKNTIEILLPEYYTLLVFQMYTVMCIINDYFHLNITLPFSLPPLTCIYLYQKEINIQTLMSQQNLFYYKQLLINNQYEKFFEDFTRPFLRQIQITIQALSIYTYTNQNNKQYFNYEDMDSFMSSSYFPWEYDTNILLKSMKLPEGLTATMTHPDYAAKLIKLTTQMNEYYKDCELSFSLSLPLLTPLSIMQLPSDYVTLYNNIHQIYPSSTSFNFPCSCCTITTDDVVFCMLCGKSIRYDMHDDVLHSCLFSHLRECNGRLFYNADQNRALYITHSGQMYSTPLYYNEEGEWSVKRRIMQMKLSKENYIYCYQMMLLNEKSF
ncbi:hypothetical protein WA158_003706 [Blastocystis sp. Blastoise]